MNKILIFSIFLFYLNGCAYKHEPIVLPTHSEKGIASYYGSGEIEEGAKTANGEVFDPSQLTAAHPSLPFGSLIKVENLDNQKEVIVRINDRGPFVKGRIVDVSYSAAEKLDMLDSGKVPVRLTFLK